MVSQLIVHGAERPLQGSVPLPSDEHILLCRIALAALSRGRTTLRARGLQAGALTLLEALSCLGIKSERASDAVVVEGNGLFGFEPPERALDLRESSHVGALVLGLSVSRPFPVELWIDEWVSELLVPALSAAHPISVEPLQGPHGAGPKGMRVVCHAVPMGTRADGVSIVTHGVFPWVKQAILLAGLRAQTPSWVEEKLATEDHLERALLRARIPLTEGATLLGMHPPRDDDAIAPQTYEAIGSAALFAPLCSMVAMVPGSVLRARERCHNPTRNDFVTVAKWAGLSISQQPLGDRQGEPVGNVEVRCGGLRAVHLAGETVLRLGDEFLYCLILMARADGLSRLEDAVPRARGGDQRIVGRALGLLRSAGIDATAQHGICVQGVGDAPLKPLRITTGGDARLALLASILALGAPGTSVIDDVDCVRGHFPRWVGTLRALGASVEVKTA